MAKLLQVGGRLLRKATISIPIAQTLRGLVGLRVGSGSGGIPSDAYSFPDGSDYYSFPDGSNYYAQP